MNARLYDSACKSMDAFGLRRFRAWATSGAHGRVLEIGVGSGGNLSFYPPTAQAIFAFDPDIDKLRSIHSRDPRIHLVAARAGDLPFPDAAFDSAIGTLVFCTIPDPPRSLGEARRVLKDGAPLFLVEHVRSPHSALGLGQDLLTPLWTRLAGGCHLNRDTRRAVERAGFTIRRVQTRVAGVFVAIQAVR